MSPEEKNLLALLEVLSASEPDDPIVLDDASMEATVDSAFDLLNDLRSPCPPTAAAIQLAEAEDRH